MPLTKPWKSTAMGGFWSQSSIQRKQLLLKLSTEAVVSFHTFVAKVLHVSKQARPGTSLSVAFLTPRVRAPNTDDQEKLSHLMECLRGNWDWLLILGEDSVGRLICYLNALFAVHPNMRSHTGGRLTMGRGFPMAASWKQKLNTKSLTECELVGVSIMMPIMLWTCHFLLAQEYGIVENLLLQINKSSILLKRNGKASSRKSTRHFKI